MLKGCIKNCSIVKLYNKVLIINIETNSASSQNHTFLDFGPLWHHHHPFIPEQLPFAEDARNGANYSAFRAPFSHWLVAFYLRGLACPFQRSFATPFSVWYQTKATRPDTHVIPQAILRRKEMNISSI